MTLRMRLLVALVGLVAIGLLIADAVTYASQRQFLMQRVDQQLQDAEHLVSLQLQGVPVGPGGRRPSLPPGTFGELLGPDGSVLGTVTYSYTQTAAPAPRLPASLPGPSDGPDVFSARASGSSSLRYRVLVQPVSDSGHLVVAIPLTETRQTLGRLLAGEIIITAAILAVLGGLAWLIIRRGLRPLEDMSRTAAAIAAGDLSRRVEPAEEHTEVGRLGLSLNVMLEKIEAAFAERTASENRMRRFLADASHELRTPLTSIRGYSELFHRGAKDRPEDLGTAMRRIEQESKRMSLLVDELLLLARLDEGRPLEHLPVDLAAVATDAVADARASDTGREISLTAPDSLVVRGDDARLRQVAGNLLSNALVHTPAGTPVAISLAAQDGLAVLRVTDSGPGLDQEQASHVFEPFYRADPSRERASGGGGLGLAIVAAIAHAHGGEATVVSKPGQGATLEVRLPIGTDEDSPVAPPDSLETGNSAAGDVAADAVTPAPEVEREPAG